MKMNAKGQVTIPKCIRDEMGITPGCEVAIRFEDGAVVVSKIGSRNRGADWIRRTQGGGDMSMTTDEIMALTRGED